MSSRDHDKFQCWSPSQTFSVAWLQPSYSACPHSSTSAINSKPLSSKLSLNPAAIWYPSIDSFAASVSQISLWFANKNDTLNDFRLQNLQGYVPEGKPKDYWALWCLSALHIQSMCEVRTRVNNWVAELLTIWTELLQNREAFESVPLGHIPSNCSGRLTGLLMPKWYKKL